MAFGKVANAGNTNTARNVFRVTFSQALSAVPTLEGWDDSTFSTTTREIFAGTTGNSSKPMLSAVATTEAAPSSAWKPASVTVGGAMANRLKGSTNYVTLSSAAPGAAGTVRFNLCLEIPSDASVPSTTSLTHVLAIRYQYTGSAPTLTWEFNDVATGTEGTPVWASFTSGASGATIKYGDTSVTSANVYITRPATGTVDSGSAWVL